MDAGARSGLSLNIQRVENCWNSLKLAHHVDIVQDGEQLFFRSQLGLHGNQRPVLPEAEQHGHEGVYLLASLTLTDMVNVPVIVFPQKRGRGLIELSDEWDQLVTIHHLTDMVNVPVIVFPQKRGRGSIELSDEWDQFVTIHHVHHALKHRVPRYRIICPDTVNGQYGRLQILGGERLDDVGPALRPCPGREGVLEWVSCCLCLLCVLLSTQCEPPIDGTRRIPLNLGRLRQAFARR